MADIKYDVKQRYGVITESSKGWTKELNLISWNDREPKFDLREWSPDGKKMVKGITLTRQDMIVLREIINQIDLTEADEPKESKLLEEASTHPSVAAVSNPEAVEEVEKKIPLGA